MGGHVLAVGGVLDPGKSEHGCVVAGLYVQARDLVNKIDDISFKFIVKNFMTLCGSFVMSEL